MTTAPTLPESERIEATARRLIADALAYGRHWSLAKYRMHACRGFDDRMRCVECGRDSRRAPDVVTIFVDGVFNWWVNSVGGGRATEYVPADIALPIARGYLAQRDELRRLNEALLGIEHQGTCDDCGRVTLVVNGKCSNASICKTGVDGPDHYP